MNYAHRSRLVGGLMILAGCGSSQGNSDVATTPTSSASTTANADTPPSRDQSLVSVTSLFQPDDVVLDGSIEEWVLLPIDEQQSDPEQPEEPRQQIPNPPDAPSRVGALFVQDGAWVVGELAAGADAGVWVGVGTRPSDLPPMGELGRAAGSIEPLVCTKNKRVFTDGTYVESDEPNPPEVIAACEAVMKRYADVEKAHRKRFSKTYFIDSHGASELGDNGKLSPVANANVAWKSTPTGGATFEAKLPAAALPRVGSAPLMSLRLAAKAQDRGKPMNTSAEQWVSVLMGIPLDYEPLGQLRAQLFAATSLYGIPVLAPPGLSFQPADPSTIESYSMGTDTITSQESKLYEKIGQLGPITIGYVGVQGDFLAIQKDGELLELIEPNHGGSWFRNEPFQVVQRNGELHVFQYAPVTYGGGSAFNPPGWSVTIVAADGTTRAGLEPDSSGSGTCMYVDNAAKTQDKKLEQVGFRVSCHGFDGQNYNATVLYKWDAKKKSYTGGEWRYTPAK